MSDYSSLNGVRVTRASLAIPWYGPWVADLTLSATDAVPTLSTLVIGPLSLAGAVYRGDAFAGVRATRLVAGFGGWQKTVASRGYANAAGVQLSMVMSDLAGEVGERVTLQSPYTIGASYSRPEAPAGRILRSLAGPAWWIDMAGTTQIGQRPTPAITSYFQILDYDPAKGHYTIATEALADWTPGASFVLPTMTEPATIGFVRHHFDNDGKASVEVLAA